MIAGRTAIYTCVSSETQARENTIGSQIASLRERVAVDGFLIEPDDCYVDEGYSGSVRVRPALERLRDAAAGGRIERLYVLPRIARRVARLGQDIFIRDALFEDACPDVLAHIQKKGSAHRSLFFLDQYGWSDVRLQTIRAILGTLKKPEILLTFAVDALIDFLSVKTAETKALLNIDLNREDVCALVDLRTGEGWRYLIQNGLYRHIQNRTGSRSTRHSSSIPLMHTDPIGCCTRQTIAWPARAIA